MSFSELARKRPRLSPPSISLRNPGLLLAPMLPMTPPDPDGADPIPVFESGLSSVDTALYVFSTELAALANLQGIYATDKLARTSMERAVMHISQTVRVGGKLVLSGVGKSGLIAKKVVATMNSVGVHSAFLHPTEALHGDLGMVRENDIVLFITFSGKTSELMLVLPHFPSTVTIIAITAHRDPATCPLLSSAGSRTTILLPAPVHEHEEISFGIPAPMTSTTVALAIGDALALATARKLHAQPGRGPAEVFREFHPGGAIGASFASTSPKMGSDSWASSSTPINSDNQSLGQTQNEIRPSDVPKERTLLDLAKPLSKIFELRYSNHIRESPHICVDNILCESIMNRESDQWMIVKDDRVTTVISPRRQHYLASHLNMMENLEGVNGQECLVDMEELIRLPQSITTSTARQLLKHDPRAPGWMKNGQTTPKDFSQLDNNWFIVMPKGRIIGVINENDEVVGVLEEEDIWLDGYNEQKR